MNAYACSDTACRLPLTACRLPRGNRGSVLAVAMVLAAVIAISLTSFMKLATTSAKLADRAFYSNGAQNLVDIGFEQALWSLNNSNWTSSSLFNPRSGYAGQYQGTFPASTPYQFTQGVSGTVKVWIDTSGSYPHAVSKATVTLGDGSTVSKYAEAYMSRRSYFKNGLVAKNTLTFVGNVAIDGWNSDPDNNSATAAVPYAGGVANDGGQIASLSIQTQSISVGNADVYGYAAVGGSQISDISVGATGRVGPYGTGNGVVDPTRVTYDFTTNFPDVTQPSSAALTHSYTISSINSATILPGGGDLPAADGKYYYYVPSISLAGHDNIAITAGTNVVITVTNTTGTSLSASGNSEIDVPATATLAMYVASDVSMTGNGVVNGSSTTANQPLAFQLYGTKAAPGTQSFAIKGNGYLSGIVYAPNASVSVGGNGDTYGAIVASAVTMNGNGNFHYDESLANLAASNLWSLNKWRELTTDSDRAGYATQLNF